MNLEEANSQFLEDITHGDPTMMQELISLFLKQTPGDLQMLERHIMTADWELAAKQAHHIKPTLTYMGAIGLHQAFSELEISIRHGVNISHLQTIEFPAIKVRFEQLYQELSMLLDSLKE